MSGSSHINVPHIQTDASSFDPATIKIPDYLKNFAQLADDQRHAMDPVLKQLLSLMDTAILRSASLPEAS